MQEVDPTGRTQHDVGAKVDGGKPTVMLCFTTMEQGLRELCGVSLPAAVGRDASVLAWSEVVLEEMCKNGISAKGTLAALAILQATLGKLPTVIQVDSLSELVMQFPDALLDVSALTGYGVGKYKAAGWQFVPNGQSRYSESYARHVLKAFTSDRDGDSGYRHWCAVAWNGLAVMSMRKLGLGLPPANADETAPGLAKEVSEPAQAQGSSLKVVLEPGRAVPNALEYGGEMYQKLYKQWSSPPANEAKRLARVTHIQSQVNAGKLTQVEADHLEQSCALQQAA